MANRLTGSRMLLSVVLLFLIPLTLPFWVVYLAAGLTDLLDGPVARRTGTVSEFGARLDTAADILFTMVCLVRLIPVISLPTALWIGTGIVGLIKGTTLLYGAAARKTLVAEHTVLNRLAGCLLFLWPLTWNWGKPVYGGCVILFLALLAAADEAVRVWKGEGQGTMEG